MYKWTKNMYNILDAYYISTFKLSYIVKRERPDRMRKGEYRA